MALYLDQEHEKTYHIRIHFNITLQTGLYIINYSVYIALFITRSELQWRRSKGEFLCCQARPKGHIFREIKQQNGFSLPLKILTVLKRAIHGGTFLIDTCQIRATKDQGKTKDLPNFNETKRQATEGRSPRCVKTLPSYCQRKDNSPYVRSVRKANSGLRSVWFSNLAFYLY